MIIHVEIFNFILLQLKISFVPIIGIGSTHQNIIN